MDSEGKSAAVHEDEASFSTNLQNFYSILILLPLLYCLLIYCWIKCPSSTWTLRGKLSMYKVLWEILIYAMINVGTCRGCSHYHQMLRMMHHWNDFTRKPEQFQMAPNTFTALQKDPFSPVSHFVEKFNQAGFQIWYDQSNHAQINMTGGSKKSFSEKKKLDFKSNTLLCFNIVQQQRKLFSQ